MRRIRSSEFVEIARRQFASGSLEGTAIIQPGVGPTCRAGLSRHSELEFTAI